MLVAIKFKAWTHKCSYYLSGHSSSAILYCLEKGRIKTTSKK